MSHRVSLRQAALHDISEHAYYIGEDSPAAADRFLDAVERVLRELADMPGMGRFWMPEHPLLGDVRVLQVPGFRRYLVFYRKTPRGLDVIRLLHSARDAERLFERGAGLE